MKWWSSLLLLTFCATSAQANEAGERRSLNRLERVTGGSSDHYQSSVTPGEDEVFFSRGWKLSTQIYRQSLGPVALGGGMQPWAPDDFDTKDPALSPSGKQIAYVSFRSHARGQICIESTERPRALGDRCLAPGRGSVLQPGWHGEADLFYLTSEPGSVLQTLVRHNLTTGEQEAVVKDSIFAFTVHPSARYVVYTSQPKPGDKTIEKVLKVRALSAHGRGAAGAQIRVDLPGLPGFPAFDPLGEYLYFSQYLEDSNGDGRINGNDHSVVFRIVANNLTGSNEPRVAEQLTTFEQDCSYLHPTREKLYLTCASRDNLDVYALPRDGVVPTGWDVETLEEAYRVSRSVSERSLLLNVMRFRFSGYQSAETLERMVSAYIVADEFGAASYYLNHLIEGEDQGSNDALAYAKLWVELQRRARLEQVGDLSESFLSWVRVREEALAQKRPHPFRTLVRAGLRAARADLDGATELLSEVRLSQLTRALEQYAHADLAFELLEQAPDTAPQRLEEIAWQMTQSRVLSTENIVYYTCLYLDALSERLPDDGARRDVIAGRLSAGPSPVVARVLEVESISLELGLSQDEAGKKKLLGNLVKLIAKTKGEYFVQRAVYVRSVVHLMARDQHKVAGKLASQWLSRVGKGSLEFTYAKQHYVETSFDKAYGHLQSDKIKWASEIFYSTLASTDEPEAHMGYTHAMLALDDTAKLEKTYERLVSRKLTGENVRLVDAIRLVTQSESRDALSVDDVRAASSGLESMDTTGLNPVLPNFLLGALYHLELVETRSGLGYDAQLAEKAHRQYMLAYDQVGDNDRLLASLLTNLGALHQLTRNFGLAATYLEQRGHVGFVSAGDEAMHALELSRALYYSGEHGRSADESARAVSLAQVDPGVKHLLAAFAGKAGFYHMVAERYEAALGYYGQQLASRGGATGDQGLRARLNSGYCQFRLGQGEAARATFEALVESVGATPGVRKAAMAGSLDSLQPARVAVLARGFLAQITDDAEQAEKLRGERMTLMETWLKDPALFSSNEISVLGFLARDCNGVAKSQLERGARGAALATMDACVGWAESLSEAGGSPLNPAMRGTVINAFILLLSGESASAPDPRLMELAAATEDALAPLAGGSTEFARDWVRVRALKQAYAYGSSRSACELSAVREELIGSDAVTLLRADPQSGVERWLALIDVPCTP